MKKGPMMDETNSAHVKGDVVGASRRIRVLMYHRIVPDGAARDPNQYWLPENEFRRQIEFLHRWGYKGITFNDYRACRQGERDLPRRPVIITFDDAYEDVYTTAIPILQEFGMKAVIFAVADLRIRASVWDHAHPQAVMPLMTGPQLLELHEAGFEIGSHTLHHKDLLHISHEEAAEEILQSRVVLETLLSAPVRSFSYPFGQVNDVVKNMVREAGYEAAVSAWSGPARFGEDDFEIRRITVINRQWSAMVKFAFSLTYPYLIMRWLWWGLKRTYKLNGAKRINRGEKMQ